MIEAEPNHDAPSLANVILREALARSASDVHFDPTSAGYDVRFRIDGMLEGVKTFEPATGKSLVLRLMVLAKLLTYRLDIPQEGRITLDQSAPVSPIELRLAIMPTTHGLRAAVRLPAQRVQPRTLEELHLPDAALHGLRRFAGSDVGMLIVTGPAGSGKTTTIYALLEHIATISGGSSSIIALEDPVERDIPGVTQIEVSPFGQLTYERALRSILRQDPQVLMLGEIRDAATATLAIQAALSGHRLIVTIHAGTPGGAIARLLEMGIEPYQITSAVYGVLAQRLVRQLVARATSPCEKRDGTGRLPVPRGTYAGRIPVAEFVSLDPLVRRAILDRADAETLASIYQKQPGYSSLRGAARKLVADGVTDEAEATRVLGPTKS
jgi:type II secretory ATPase GspE/PulE/Tfp pilus assembly ATPase PilB-like protein